MSLHTRNLLKYANRALYLISIALLVSGLILSLAAMPVEAASGSVKTKTSCGASSEDANTYAVGNTVYISFSDMGAGAHTWTITYTNKPGKPLVTVAGSSPLIQGTGTVTGASGCFPAWVVQPEEAGYHFTADVGGKSDGYNVTAPTATPTATATRTATATFTFTPTATATFTPTATATFTFTPTATATFTPTATATFTPTATATHTSTATFTPTATATHTATATFAPTTLVPTETTPAPTETTPAPTETTPAPTDPSPTETGTPSILPTDSTPNPTSVPTLSMPAAVVDHMVVNPITGADTLHSASSRGNPRTLFMSSFSVFGIALVVTGYRRKKGL